MTKTKEIVGKVLQVKDAPKCKLTFWSMTTAERHRSLHNVESYRAHAGETVLVLEENPYALKILHENGRILYINTENSHLWQSLRMISVPSYCEVETGRWETMSVPILSLLEEVKF